MFMYSITLLSQMQVYDDELYRSITSLIHSTILKRHTTVYKTVTSSLIPRHERSQPMKIWVTNVISKQELFPLPLMSLNPLYEISWQVEYFLFQ